MILVVSSAPKELSAFVGLCESRGWTCAECDSLRALRKQLRTIKPTIVLTRHKLEDGYADDVMLAIAGLAAKVIVLIGAGAPSSLEARQVAVGADCVLRDPVRSEVLLAYLAKYWRTDKNRRAAVPQPARKSFSFAGATVHPTERKLQQGDATVGLSPREVELAELLFESKGEVVTYETLYSEILGQKFRGDTSNMRVLLGKLAESARDLGVDLRTHVAVIPKLGYRYHEPAPKRLDGPRPRSSLPSAA